ncbi:ABC transporter permease [Arthrobacter sp. R3-55]
MIEYILKRLLLLLPTVAVPMILLFVLLRLTPGDPAAAVLGDDATVEQINALRDEMGLNDPILVQFLTWLGNLARFDFGESIFLNQPVAGLVLSRAAITAQLAVFALVIAVLVGPALGAFSATLRNRKLDKALVVGSAVGIAMPTFWLAILMIFVFGVLLKVLPVAGFTSIFQDPLKFFYYMALPALSLGLLEAATLYRYSRNGVMDAKNQPYVTTARAQGIPERVITSRYIFRSALVPIVTMVGVAAAGLLGGAVVTESVFSIPGLGQLLLTAVQRRDYPVIEGCIFFIAVVFVVVNLLVDLTYAFLDPRIRLDSKEA